MNLIFSPYTLISAAAADRDATALEEGEKKGVDANHIKCPSKHDDEFCRGYRQGYSDEAQARLE